MKFLLFMILAFTASTVQGAVIAYELSTGKIVSWIDAGVSGYAGDPGNYGIITSTQNVFPIEHHKINTGTLAIEKKSAAEITVIEDNKTMTKLLNQMLGSQKLLDAYKELGKQGVDVAQSTTTISNRIETLKTDYQALKNK